VVRDAFTEIALEAGRKYFPLEPSEAVFVNAENNDQPNLCLIKATMPEAPLRSEVSIMCFAFGVVQAILRR